MRGRFHPSNGQFYACGLFAWAGDRTQPGGFYRLRATGKPMFVPVELHGVGIPWRSRSRDGSTGRSPPTRRITRSRPGR